MNTALRIASVALATLLACSAGAEVPGGRASDQEKWEKVTASIDAADAKRKADGASVSWLQEPLGSSGYRRWHLLMLGALLAVPVVVVARR